MIEYAPFNKKQARYFRRSLKSWLNVSEGGKRASKNILNILCFAENLETHPDKLHLVGGVNQATARMNIMDSDGFGLEHYFRGRSHYGTYNGLDCLYIQTKTGQKIVLMAGGKDAISYRNIKGFSLGSVYVTEANECHQTFIQECMDRTLASKDRKIFFDINPKSPRHWFYVDFLDFQDKQKAEGRNKGYNYEHFTIWDNMSLSDEQLTERLNTYDKTSLWYQADILGKRTAASGRIYTGWTAENVKSPKYIAEKLRLVEFAIGVDIGGTDATVATLVGYTHQYNETVLVDGYYHKQGKNVGMTHAQYAKEIVDKIEEWVDRYPRVAAAPVFVESADKLFRQALSNELRDRGFYRMVISPSYKKDGIIDRIRLHNILVQQDRLIVSSHMKHWILAYENAVWNDDEFEKGEWERVDDGSYPVDCLDSCEYATQPYKPKLLKGA
jgi:PBSX family phage terminase large subunit